MTEAVQPSNASLTLVFLERLSLHVLPPTPSILQEHLSAQFSRLVLRNALPPKPACSATTAAFFPCEPAGRFSAPATFLAGAGFALLSALGLLLVPRTAA